jgi:hypothetical protein
LHRFQGLNWASPPDPVNSRWFSGYSCRTETDHGAASPTRAIVPDEVQSRKLGVGQAGNL